MSDRKNQSLNQITSKVLAISPADSNAAHNHFLSRLSFETDPSDVYHDITNKISGPGYVGCSTVSNPSGAAIDADVSFTNRPKVHANK